MARRTVHTTSDQVERLGFTHGTPVEYDPETREVVTVVGGVEYRGYLLAQVSA